MNSKRYTKIEILVLLRHSLAFILFQAVIKLVNSLDLAKNMLEILPSSSSNVLTPFARLRSIIEP